MPVGTLNLLLLHRLMPHTWLQGAHPVPEADGASPLLCHQHVAPGSGAGHQRNACAQEQRRLQQRTSQDSAAA